MTNVIQVQLSPGVRCESLTSLIQFRWFLGCLVGVGVVLCSGARCCALFLWYRQSFQVAVVAVVDESSATVPSLEASPAVPLSFSSTSGVLGGADFRAGLPVASV